MSVNSRILLYPLFLLYGGRPISKDKQQINGDIRAKEVRLIDENGDMRGVMGIREALAIAEEANLDLVNVSPNAEPPVCKILDFGKYRYELQKKDKMAKKNQKTMQVKEVRLSTFIEEHDVNVKANTAIKFLKDGDKVKVSLRFRGRERDYTAKGFDVMNSFAELVSEYGIIDKKPKFEGRSLTMFLSPKNSK
ncbi:MULTISPECIES: translation initiation factor IF-3 [Mogibacterium]|uniref:translation initiation factor IF-3 n=1 Tax=Mogibacterium diversum TaxID=114527 RepID=UPI003FA5BB07